MDLTHAPVLVGGGQVVHRPGDPGDPREPLALMVEAVERAAEDAGGTRLLGALELVAVVRGAWPYPDPGRLIAERVGASGARSLLTADGGQTPQALVNRLATRIAAGELDVAVVAGGETIYSRRRLRAEGRKLPITEQGPSEPDEGFGPERPMGSDGG